MSRAISSAASALPQTSMPAEAHRPIPASHPLAKLVERAVDAIAPVWPLATFVARHPWPHLERFPFPTVAAALRQVQGLHLYPPAPVLEEALARGEIRLEQLDAALTRWLDRQRWPVPRAQAEAVFRALLWELTEEPSPSTWPGPAALPAPAAPGAPVPLAVRPLSARLGGPAQRLDQLMIRWCQLFLDQGLAAWPLPGRQRDLYAAWRELVRYDPALTREERRRLADWPASPEAGLQRALQLLGVPEADQEAYLRSHLLALPGWSGLLWWQSEQAGRGATLLVEYLAVRLALEWALCAEHVGWSEPRRRAEASAGRQGGRGGQTTGKAVANGVAAPTQPGVAAPLNPWLRWGGMTAEAWACLRPEEQQQCLEAVARFVHEERWLLWLEAWEESLAAPLRAALERLATPGEAAPAEQAPVAQLLFCIDVRSDALRRHLEAAGPFATYGCAGFFNLPILARELESTHAHPACPAIVSPQVEIRELTDPQVVASWRRRRRAAGWPSFLFKKAKQHALASLALPELSGPWLGLQALARTVAPAATQRLLERAETAAAPKPPARLSLRSASRAGSAGLPVGMTVEQMVAAAAGLFRSIGLTHFAPLVVVCGHESQTVNNPHASALDCGACGGASGRFNARAFAAMCNLSEVRQGLARLGLTIPEETVFVPAVHVTTTDELRWLEAPAPGRLSPAAREAWERLQQALPEVRRRTCQQRLPSLPGARQAADPLREVERRAADWSEIRPEWGLAGNAAFVVSRRGLPLDGPLVGRIFHHSYDWRLDPQGERLAAIVAGPVTVGQWINLQYYASTLAPHVHGSGPKATQTVTGGIGVMQGNGSDLLAGLPWQSVAASDTELFHRPLRLLVVLEAPTEVVERLLRQDAAFRQKVAHGWLKLASLDPRDGRWQRWDPERVTSLLDQPARPAQAAAPAPPAASAVSWERAHRR